MALNGNRGEWSEPYALLKLLADGKLYLGGENFEKISDIFYPIVRVIRHEKNRIVDFSYKDKLVVISTDETLFEIPIVKFIANVKLCFDRIKVAKTGKGTFSIPEIESFLSSFSVTSLKAKSRLKNDITIQIEDPNSLITPTLGFSIKSQLGRPSTLLNASKATNFTYKIIGSELSADIVSQINDEGIFSKKFSLLKDNNASLELEGVENEIFKSNLQTIDFNFEKILAEIILLFYSNEVSSENTVANFTKKIFELNPIGYNLSINSQIYELIMKKFLTDYALGMRATEVWTRNYQATGGYLIVKDDGDLICYHFYFTKNFEDYLFRNTKLETPSVTKHGFGKIYSENGAQKMKLNLQIRFIK